MPNQTFKVAAVLCILFSFHLCSEDPILKKIGGSGTAGDTDTDPSTPYDGPVDIALLDWTADQQIASNCSGVDFLFSYSKSFSDGEPVNGTDDAFYFGATGTLVSGGDANQSLFYYVSLDLEDTATGTDTIVDGNTGVTLPRNTNYHYAMVWDLDDNAPVVYQFDSGAWSVYSSGGTFNKSGDTLGGSINLEDLTHPDTGVVAEFGLAITAYLFDSGTGDFECGLTENSFYASDTVELFDYLSLDFAFATTPNDSSRIDYGLGDYVHTLADNSDLDFWPKEKLTTSTSESVCDVHAAYDDDWIYIGISGDDMAGSETWLSFYTPTASDTLGDFSYGSVDVQSDPELFRIFGLVDVSTPTLEYYENDGASWSLSGDTVDYEVFVNGNFVKWKLSRALIANQSRFFIHKTDSDEVVCTLGEGITLPLIQLGIEPTLQIDSNLVIPPGLQ